MVHWRDYTGYGPQCTPENIYRVMVKIIQLTKQFLEDDPGYDANELLQQEAQRFAQAEDSIIAYKYIAERIATMGFYEPLAEPTIGFDSLIPQDYGGAVYDYVAGIADNFTDAIMPYIEELNGIMRRIHQ